MRAGVQLTEQAEGAAGHAATGPRRRRRALKKNHPSSCGASPGCGVGQKREARRDERGGAAAWLCAVCRTSEQSVWPADRGSPKLPTDCQRSPAARRRRPCIDVFSRAAFVVAVRRRPAQGPASVSSVIRCRSPGRTYASSSAYVAVRACVREVRHRLRPTDVRVVGSLRRQHSKPAQRRPN